MLSCVYRQDVEAGAVAKRRLLADCVGAQQQVCIPCKRHLSQCHDSQVGWSRWGRALPTPAAPTHPCLCLPPVACMLSLCSQLSFQLFDSSRPAARTRLAPLAMQYRSHMSVSAAFLLSFFCQVFDSRAVAPQHAYAGHLQPCPAGVAAPRPLEPLLRRLRLRGHDLGAVHGPGGLLW